ncbi:MAG: hypothetical protein Q4D51_07235 [Eubacteriales bacterium]|nr:hypothetical protein [Eubacteriales bacterium]
MVGPTLDANTILPYQKKDIRFVDDPKEKKISRKTKKKYGYEPKELNAETRKNVAKGIRKSSSFVRKIFGIFFVVVTMVIHIVLMCMIPRFKSIECLNSNVLRQLMHIALQT